MNFLLRILLEIGWHMGLIHVPDWDNTPSPWVKRKVEELPPVDKKMDRPDVTTRAWGASEPGKEQEYHQWIETTTGDNEWDFDRFDGQTTYDFRNWGHYDDWVIERRGYTTEKKRNNYILVRPDVLGGMKNKEIASKHGNSIRWAEEYAGAVREMCELRRRKEDASPSPTIEMEVGPAK